MVVLAQIDERKPEPLSLLVFDAELIAYVVGALILIGIGIVLVKRFRSSARRGEEASKPEHSLAHYESLLEEGLIDAKEFERIRSLLAKQPPTPPAKS